MRILQEKSQIESARQQLRARDLSCLASPLRTLLIKLGISRGVIVGDEVKSWDVLATLEFIEENLDRDAPILDIGCYASEVPVALHKMGYRNLTGADLNPELLRMPFAESINYVNTNFMHTSFDDGSFDAVTSISVIEHGFDGESLLTEISRILKPGGYFIASFDYWPEKIDTSGVTFFGMDWTIFSREEVEKFIDSAARHDLFPVEEPSFEGKEKAIECADREYTFAWLVLKKSS